MPKSCPTVTVVSTGSWVLIQSKLEELGLTNILDELKGIATIAYVYCLSFAQAPTTAWWVLTAEPRDEFNPNVYKPFMVGQHPPHGGST